MTSGELPSNQGGEIYSAVLQAQSVEETVNIVRTGFGFLHATFHLGHAPGDIDAPYLKSTYPAEWLTRYLLKRYLLVDPVVREGFSRRTPFFWHQIEMTPGAVELMNDALANNIGASGYSIPVVDQGNRRSLFSVTSMERPALWESYITQHQAILAKIANLIHNRAIIEVYGTERPFPHLSPREAECLSLTARGKDAGTIAVILGLTENTVRTYLRTTRHKLNCTTLAQAVAKAMEHRAIPR